MYHKLSSLLLTILICSACATGPAPQRASEQTRNGIYYLNQGTELFARGCYPRAMDYFQDAHQLFSAVDDRAGVIQALNSIGDTYFRLDDMDSALRVYGDAISLAQTEAHHPGLVRALSNQAAALMKLNRRREAALALDRAADLEKSNGEYALYLKTRALWCIHEGQRDRSRTFLEAALEACDAGGQDIRSSIFFAMGHLFMQNDQPEQARSRFDQALALDREKHIPHDIARDLEAIGMTYAAVDQHLRAIDYFKRSAKIYALLKDTPRAQTVVTHLEKSARLADADVGTTLFWIQTWLSDKTGNAICD